jgi:hypothetical protein
MRVSLCWFIPLMVAMPILRSPAQTPLRIPSNVRDEIRQRWPLFSVEGAQSAVLFDEEDEYRREFIGKTMEGRVSTSADVIDAHENHEFASEWGSSVSVSVLLCPREQTVNIIEKGISDLLKARQYQTIMPWNTEGFLLAERPPGSVPAVFEGLKDDIKLIVKVDHRLQEHLGVVSLLYQIFASPRRTDKKAFEDRSQDDSARRYIGTFLETMKDTVAGCVQQSCRRVSSGRRESRREALARVDSELTTEQAEHVKAKLEEKE